MQKLSRLVGRKTPYTEEEIVKLKCFRCGKPAKYQWQICSDGNTYRAICECCDIELNETVLVFMKFPDWEKKLQNYIKKVRGITDDRLKDIGYNREVDERKIPIRRTIQRTKCRSDH
jgi:hypothetical protein